MKNDAIINGIRPEPGMWIVSHEHRRIYGQVVRVRGSGAVVCADGPYQFETNPEVFHRARCDYVSELPQG